VSRGYWNEDRASEQIILGKKIFANRVLIRKPAIKDQFENPGVDGRIISEINWMR
jgi:hypothetical protein